jgi:hypothetical protein
VYSAQEMARYMVQALGFSLEDCSPEMVRSLVALYLMLTAFKGCDFVSPSDRPLQGMRFEAALCELAGTVWARLQEDPSLLNSFRLPDKAHLTAASHDAPRTILEALFEESMLQYACKGKTEEVARQTVGAALSCRLRPSRSPSLPPSFHPSPSLPLSPPLPLTLSLSTAH